MKLLCGFDAELRCIATVFQGRSSTSLEGPATATTPDYAPSLRVTSHSALLFWTWGVKLQVAAFFESMYGTASSEPIMKGTDVGTPNREPQEYSRTIIGIYLSGPFYSLFIPAIFQVPDLRFPIHLCNHGAAASKFKVHLHEGMPGRHGCVCCGAWGGAPVLGCQLPPRV